MNTTYRCAAIASLFLFGQSAAAETWDLANEYPATSLTGQIADKFAALVGEKTAGEIEIVVHHGGALGYKSVDHFDAVSDGALQIALSPFTFWTGIDPIFQLCALPFVAPTTEDAHALLEIARPEYQAVLEGANQIMLLGAPYPSSGLWADKSIDSMDDLKDLKVRTYDAASTMTMRNAGALPLQISWSDVPAQLSTNAIDSVLTSANGGIGVQMWELQSNFTAVNYGAALFAIHVNRDVLEAHTPEVQAAVLEAAEDAEVFGWNLAAELAQSDFEVMRQNGMTVTETISDPFRVALKEAGQPFIDDWVAEVGARAQAVLDTYNDR